MAKAMPFIFAIYFAGSCMFAQVRFKPGSEPDGYGGVAWNTDIAALKGMNFSHNAAFVCPAISAHHESLIQKVFVNTAEILKIGNITVDKIEYFFWNDTLSDVKIQAKGREKWRQVRKFIFNNYGEGHHGTIEMGGKKGTMYSWNDKKTYMELSYIDNQITLKMTSSMALNRMCDEAIKQIQKKTEGYGSPEQERNDGLR